MGEQREVGVSGLGSVMRALVYSVAMVLLTIACCVTTTGEVSMLEDNMLELVEVRERADLAEAAKAPAASGTCTKSQLDAATKKDAAAKGALKAVKAPAASHPKVVKAAADAAKELKALQANPACKKLLAAAGP